MFGRIDIDARELDALSCEAEIEDLDENDLALLNEDEDEDFDEEDEEEDDEEDDEEEYEEDEEYANAEDEIWAEFCQECPEILDDLIGRDD